MPPSTRYLPKQDHYYCFGAKPVPAFLLLRINKYLGIVLIPKEHIKLKVAAHDIGVLEHRWGEDCAIIAFCAKDHRYREETWSPIARWSRALVTEETLKEVMDQIIAVSIQQQLWSQPKDWGKE